MTEQHLLPQSNKNVPLKQTLLALCIAAISQGVMADQTEGSQETHSVEEVRVIGQAAGLDKALAKQRLADNILSVLSSDDIGQFPDSNVSESLARMTGISVERDQGEGRFVRIRGLSPSLNAVTFNGTKVTAPGADGRSVGLDVVPSDLVSSLEVSKTQTPDKDADALGGSIEVKTLSAFDRKGFYLTTSAEAAHDDNTGEASPALSLTTSNVFNAFDGQKNLGVAFAVSWEDRDFGSDNVETGGAWNFEDGEALEEMEQRRYDINRERMGFGLNLDLRPDENNEYYLRTLYSQRDDDETRQAIITEFKRELLGLDGAGNLVPVLEMNDDGELEPVIEDGLAQGQAGIGEVKREIKQRVEEQTISSLVIGAVNRVNNWTLDYALGYSAATEEKPFHIDGGVFELELDDGVSFSGTEQPKITAPREFYDASEFDLDEIETLVVDIDDQEMNLRFDFSRDITLADKPSEIKFGTKLSTRTKKSDEDVVTYGDYDATLSEFSSGDVDYALDQYGPSINGSALLNALGSAGEIEAHLEDSNINDFEIDEDINAAYVMLTTDIDRWRMIAGLRYEGTSIDANGKSYNDDTEVVDPTLADNDYSHILPSVQARLNLTDKSVIRMAWTNSVVRATFEELSPGTFIEGNDAERGNPKLDPWESSNLDIGYEYYFGEASAFSAFLFYKDIDNFIYEREFDNVEGFDSLSTFDNGESAELLGLELSYSKKFDGLAAPWNSLLVATNVTATDAEADIGNRKIPLPSQSDLVGNLSLGYENSRMSLRLSGNYKSEYLLETGDERIEDSYVDESLHIDLTARFWVNENVQISFHGVNLTDQEYYVYSNNPRYNTQYETYGPNYKIGVKYSNF